MLNRQEGQEDSGFGCAHYVRPPRRKNEKAGMASIKEQEPPLIPSGSCTLVLFYCKLDLLFSGFQYTHLSVRSNCDVMSLVLCMVIHLERTTTMFFTYIWHQSLMVFLLSLAFVQMQMLPVTCVRSTPLEFCSARW